MSQPAKRSQKPKVIQGLRHGMWLLLLLIVVATLLDVIWFNKTATETHKLLWAKSFALGALLNYLNHFVFAWFAYRYTGMQARKNIVNQFYMGEVSKWVISLIGFSVIFITIKPLDALALFIGFIVMQISQSIIFWKMR